MNLHFKPVIRNLMNDDSKVFIEMAYQGAEVEEKISLTDHYLDYACRFSKIKNTI